MGPARTPRAQMGPAVDPTSLGGPALLHEPGPRFARLGARWFSASFEKHSKEILERRG
jgi:hypothetical protein